MARRQKVGFESEFGTDFTKMRYREGPGTRYRKLLQITGWNKFLLVWIAHILINQRNISDKT